MQAFQIQEKLADLEERLVANTDNIAELLRDIHRSLKNDPDVVTILTEAECSTLVRGLLKQTTTVIATKALKSRPKKAIKDLDIGLDL